MRNATLFTILKKKTKKTKGACKGRAAGPKTAEVIFYAGWPGGGWGKREL